MAPQIPTFGDERHNSTLTEFAGVNLLWIDSFSAAFYALIAACAATAISFYNIYTHLKYYTRPGLQRYIVRILFVVPLYAVCSWLSLAWPSIGPIIETIRDCYEAFVVYLFLGLILTYLGGEGSCVNKMIHDSPLHHPWPLCWLEPMDKDGRFLRNCKKGVIQFVIVKPLFALVSLIMLAVNRYESLSYQLLLLVVYNVSYTWALYCLFLIYAATKKHLVGFSPVSKFLAVKLVVFMTYWQALLVSVIPGMKARDGLASKWEDFIICLEMVIFSILHLVAFSVTYFKTSFEHIPSATVLENAKEVMSVNDIVMDAYHNFKPSYQDYVLSRGEDEFQEKYRARTFLVGNLDNPRRSASSATSLDNGEGRLAIPSLTPLQIVSPRSDEAKEEDREGTAVVSSDSCVGSGEPSILDRSKEAGLSVAEEELDFATFEVDQQGEVLGQESAASIEPLEETPPTTTVQEERKN